MFDLTGRVALVTGAGQHVGAGIARALAAQGASVAVNDIVAERAEATAADIAGAVVGTAIGVAFDVTDLGAVRDGVAAVQDRLGPIDILVNNAGNAGAHRMVPTPFREMDPAGWSAPIDVNLYGVLNCCHAVIGAMCDRGWGRVITISSGAGRVGLTLGVSTYAAGKGGAIAFMRHLAVENARTGVTANTVALGLMQPPQGGGTDALARQIPVGRTGTPEDVGPLCVYLASEEASWMTGQTIELNGGSVTS
ncbi:MAG TPA: SDR family NAD(P)-dependent oxidoreductase [Acidimicrobiales bacterium]|nr:SDR family NAD(P)-dependent oxidoreductase [Acidimicrobiales bacterium]